MVVRACAIAWLAHDILLEPIDCHTLRERNTKRLHLALSRKKTCFGWHVVLRDLAEDHRDAVPDFGSARLYAWRTG